MQFSQIHQQRNDKLNQRNLDEGQNVQKLSMVLQNNGDSAAKQQITEASKLIRSGNEEQAYEIIQRLLNREAIYFEY